LPTVDGGETRWRAVIRSDFVNRLSGNGLQAMLDYGVRTIVDLRGPEEVQKEPSAFATPTSDPRAPTYLHRQIEWYYPHVGALIAKAQSRAEVYCIILDHYPDAVMAIMQAIANAQPGGVVIHCNAGQDRTGIVSGMLLSLVDVPVDAIAGDYAESQRRLWPLIQKRLAEAGSEAALDYWLRPTATADMMVAMLAHVQTRYGGVPAYLRAAGMTEAEIDRLRARLR
jgi:protein tyrosine/serine phosphatase